MCVRIAETVITILKRINERMSKVFLFMIIFINLKILKARFPSTILE
ncbi:hypothetical protein IC006_2343 [Sulfuracidifex tepidarius]|uniref:Uncharacterized protein n=1 Tax=Sulfuracidifex tepidarius TaxID=1294262 RepID=A0A510DXV1_9CREN|nr:hypothetical protein IC006_2343 [Sulfuracidifex tepidarius]